MARIITTLDDYVTYLNTLYNSSSTPPSSGDEDYSVWTSLANIAVSVWENEEGVLWRELFVKLEDAPDGDKSTDGGNSYDLPTLFSFPACGTVYLNDEAYKVIKQEEVQLYEESMDRFCYFTLDTLEFNKELTIPSGMTISYSYYKFASKLTTGSSTFEMGDPMFAVYFALAELKKEEGNATELQLASQKLEGMKMKNIMPTWFQEDSFQRNTGDGFTV